MGIFYTKYELVLKIYDVAQCIIYKDIDLRWGALFGIWFIRKPNICDYMINYTEHVHTCKYIIHDGKNTGHHTFNIFQDGLTYMNEVW